MLYGGSQYETGRAISMDAAGNLLIVGSTESFAAQDDDYLFLKLDQEGNVDWAKKYGFYYEDIANSIVPSLDGGYVINGTAGWGSTYNDQMYFFKTDASGTVDWDHSYGGTSDEKGYDLIQDDDGGFLFLGTTESSGAGGTDVYLIKTDAGGEHDWGYAVGTDGDDHGYALIKDMDGDYALAGEYCCDDGFGGRDVKFMKFDEDMNIEISKIYGGTGTDVGNDLVMSHDSGYVVAGYTNSFGSGGYDYYVRKMDKDGDAVWSYTYGTTDDDVARSIVRTSDNGFAILGYTQNDMYDNFTDMWLVKIDANGQFEWSFVYGIDGFEEGYSLLQKSNGNYLATGFGYGSQLGTGGRDVILVEFLADGSACIGTYVGSSGASDNTGGSHGHAIYDDQVNIFTITDNEMLLKVKCKKLKPQEAKGTSSVRGTIVPEVDIICR